MNSFYMKRSCWICRRSRGMLWRRSASSKSESAARSRAQFLELKWQLEDDLNRTQTRLDDAFGAFRHVPTRHAPRLKYFSDPSAEKPPAPGEYRVGEAKRGVRKSMEELLMRRNSSDDARNAYRILVEISKMTPSERNAVFRHPKNFLDMFGLDVRSYHSFWIVGIMQQAVVDVEKTPLLELMFSLYRETSKHFHHHIPEDLRELRMLAEGGICLANTYYPQFRSLGTRILLDICHGKLLELEAKGQFLEAHALIACLCLTAMPRLTHPSLTLARLGQPKVSQMDFRNFLKREQVIHGKHEDRDKICRVTMEVYKKKPILTHNDAFHIIHMLYRQNIRLNGKEEVELVKRCYRAAFRSRKHTLHRTRFLRVLSTVVKCDRIYGILGKEFFQYLRQYIQQLDAREYAKFDLNVHMRICYLLAPKAYCHEFLDFFDRNIEAIFTLSRARTRSAKFTGLLMISLMKAHYRVPEPTMKRVVDLYRLNANHAAYPEQLINACRALCALQYAPRIGKDLLLAAVEMGGSFRALEGSKRSLTKELVPIIKHMHVFLPDLLYSSMSKAEVDRLVYRGCGDLLKRQNKASSTDSNAHAFVIQCLRSLVGTEYVGCYRLLPFFDDMDFYLIMDDAGNLLPVSLAREVAVKCYTDTDRMLASYLAAPDADEAARDAKQPVLTELDYGLGVVEPLYNQIRKLHTSRGNIIFLRMVSKSPISGARMGTCHWQHLFLEKFNCNNFIELDFTTLRQLYSEICAHLLDEDASEHVCRQREINEIREKVKHNFKHTIAAGIKRYLIESGKLKLK